MRDGSGVFDPRTGGVAGVNVEDEGTPVPNTPHTVINFEGAGVTAVDDGGGVTKVTIPGSAGGSGNGAGLIWGNKEVGQSAGSPRFLDPGFDSSNAARVAPAIGLPSPMDGNVQNLQILHNVPGTSGVKTVSYTVQINGVDSSVVATLLENATTGNSGANTAAVVKGDNITIKVTKSADLDVTPQNVTSAMEIA